MSYPIDMNNTTVDPWAWKDEEIPEVLKNAQLSIACGQKLLLINGISCPLDKVIARVFCNRPICCGQSPQDNDYLKMARALKNLLSKDLSTLIEQTSVLQRIGHIFTCCGLACTSPSQLQIILSDADFSESRCCEWNKGLIWMSNNTIWSTKKFSD